MKIIIHSKYDCYILSELFSDMVNENYEQYANLTKAYPQPIDITRVHLHG
jgi:hypothetical protein